MNRNTPARPAADTDVSELMDEELKMNLLKQFDEVEEEIPKVTDSQIEINTDETVTIEDDSNLPENKKYTDVLKKYFGYNTFRKPQVYIILA